MPTGVPTTHEDPAQSRYPRRSGCQDLASSNSRPACLYAACASFRIRASGLPAAFALVIAFLRALQQWLRRGSLPPVFGDALVAGGFDRLDALTIAGCTGPPAFFGAVLPVAFTGFITVTFAREIKVSATTAPGFRAGNKFVPLSDGRSDFVTFAPDGRSDSLAS